MKEFIKFCLEHIEIIFSVISCLVSFIVFIIALIKYKGDTKKMKDDKFLIMVLDMLPSVIKQAELAFTNGADKYTYVMTYCLDFLNSLGLSKDEAKAKYSLIIDKKLEEILSTPQKKEKEVIANVEKNEKSS